jgi:hypothetical protein
MSTNISTIDLTQRPPRSPRVRIGGFVILARALDKGRAKVAGKLGEYHFACPLDKRFLDFVKIDPDALYGEIKAGKGDWEILEWILQNAGHKPTPWEITQWSAHQEVRVPDSIQAKERNLKEVTRINKERTDILTGFDLLDLDDHVTFGGKA